MAAARRLMATSYGGQVPSEREVPPVRLPATLGCPEPKTRAVGRKRRALQAGASRRWHLMTPGCWYHHLAT